MGSWAGGDWTQAHSQSLLSWADPSFSSLLVKKLVTRSFQFFFSFSFVPVWGHLRDPEGGKSSLLVHCTEGEN